MISSETFFSKAETHFNKQRPFAIYRKPKSDELVLVLQNDNVLYEYNKTNTSGFLFSKAFETKKYLIPFLKSDVLKTLTPSEKPLINYKIELHNTEKKHFIDVIKKATENIKAGLLKKVVISRCISVRILENLNAIQLLKSLCFNYKDAFTYLWYHPNLGMWIGASPELLMSLNNNTFKTVALAGTKKSFSDFSEKEKEEQHIVTTYIVKQINTFTENIHTSSVKYVPAGNLWHIQTTISAKLKEGVPWEALADTLSPTPAVCGVPKLQAQNFILENETYNRSFYTGLVGEVLDEQQVNIFVNIRCAEINAPYIKVFAGAGITEASNPEKEWEETIQKSQTILKTLNSKVCL